MSRRALLGSVLLAGAAGRAMAGDDAIQLESYVEVDAGRLYLLVRGHDRTAPLLLWLHGGPGGAERPLFRLYNGALERRFVVAYFDQRGAGRSYDPKADRGRLTVDQHLADLDAVVEHLRRTLDRDQVILLGHSWGTALGLLYARDQPRKVAAFLGVGVETSAPAMQQAAYDFALYEARARGDTWALRRLARLGAPPYSVKDELALEGYVEDYGGSFHRPPNYFSAAFRLLAHGYVEPAEISLIARGNDSSFEAMNDELGTLDLTRAVPRLETPVGFMLGRYDHITDSALAAAYFEQLEAPAKRLIWFERSAHNITFEEPKAFNAAVPRVLTDLGVLGREIG